MTRTTVPVAGGRLSAGSAGWPLESLPRLGRQRRTSTQQTRANRADPMAVR